MKPAASCPAVALWLLEVDVWEFRVAAPMMAKIMKNATPMTMLSMRKAKRRFHHGASARWTTGSIRTLGSWA